MIDGFLSYREAPGVNYSALSDFNKGPDYCLMEKESKSYFEFGKAFELLLFDKVKNTAELYERFFTFEHNSSMPEILPQWIEAKEDLTKKYKLNKDGSKNKTAKNLHTWLDVCLVNPGKIPISTAEYDALNFMADNMLKMVVYGQTLEDLLKEAVFNVPIFWIEDGVEKKALLDCAVMTENAVYPFDFKTTADLGRFIWSVKNYYWIQAIHYEKGVTAKMAPSNPMVFLAASKQPPYLAQPFMLDEWSRKYANLAYLKLVNDFTAWVEAGRRPVGFKPMKKVKVYFDADETGAIYD